MAADTEVSRQLTAASGAGVVTPFGNSEALARELRRLLSDEALSAEMGRRGQQTAEAFDGRRLWARNAQEFEKVMRGYGNV